MKKKGFTLIELLVVVAIIGVLATVVLGALGDARSKSRDAKRKSDITQLSKILELYYLDNGSYPTTGSLNNVFGDSTCTGLTIVPDTNTENWIPGLVSGGYISSLPQNPAGSGYDFARKTLTTRACYMYASDGNKFVLSAWGVVENGPIKPEGSLYRREGFRETYITDQYYLCNHPNIGNTISGDYYKYSYTVTNETNCTW